MSCKSAIYTANTSAVSTTLTAQQPAASLPVGSVIRRFGRNIQLSGNEILIRGEGYYDVDASVTMTPVSAGNYTVSLYRQGVAIPGATQTVTAAAASAISFNIASLVRLQCCDSSSTLSIVLTTTAPLPSTVTVNNVGVVAEKL